ncbi:MAG: CmcJ/NvfI family oxidoreductase [Pseudomonadota bacterium]
MQDVAIPTEVTASVEFIIPQEEKPQFLSSAMTGDVPKVMFETVELPVKIANLRLRPEAANIDREGFELMTIKTSVEDLHDDKAVKEQYYPEIVELLKERFGASRVEIFDATRRSDSSQGAANPDGLRGPARRVHVDYTEASGPQRLRDVLGDEEAERLLKSDARVIQVNVWRPIKGPVKRAPLALADASSVPAADLIATDQVFPDRVGEIYHLAHSEDHKWYFAPEMTNDEIFLIKGWDTDDRQAKYTPHGAFDDPNTAPDAPPRESIEIRTMVIVE